MDIALLNMSGSGRRNKVWEETMVNLEAKVEFVRENNKIVGYVISAVKIVASHCWRHNAHNNASYRYASGSNTYCRWN